VEVSVQAKQNDFQHPDGDGHQTEDILNEKRNQLSPVTAEATVEVPETKMSRKNMTFYLAFLSLMLLVLIASLQLKFQ
jgi:hypothetical protein